ncbi:serine-rich adhesin for platelets-like [Pecten maximus]|uniref:serine-rich adhesin for platelets-like n=1 Tax=Pecten maximus TaxID=6579 RepID=UPI0014585C00|nr:serine-rich adhesin for platelets-like [Pecten maximus]
MLSCPNEYDLENIVNVGEGSKNADHDSSANAGDTRKVTVDTDKSNSDIDCFSDLENMEHTNVDGVEMNQNSHSASENIKLQEETRDILLHPRCSEMANENPASDLPVRADEVDGSVHRNRVSSVIASLDLVEPRLDPVSMTSDQEKGIDSSTLTSTKSVIRDQTEDITHQEDKVEQPLMISSNSPHEIPDNTGAIDNDTEKSKSKGQKKVASTSGNADEKDDDIQIGQRADVEKGVIYKEEPANKETVNSEQIQQSGSQTSSSSSEQIQQSGSQTSSSSSEQIQQSGSQTSSSSSEQIQQSGSQTSSSSAEQIQQSGSQTSSSSAEKLQERIESSLSTDISIAESERVTASEQLPGCFSTDNSIKANCITPAEQILEGPMTDGNLEAEAEDVSPTDHILGSTPPTDGNAEAETEGVTPTHHILGSTPPTDGNAEAETEGVTPTDHILGSTPPTDGNAEAETEGVTQTDHILGSTPPTDGNAEAETEGVTPTDHILGSTPPTDDNAEAETEGVTRTDHILESTPPANENTEAEAEGMTPELKQGGHKTDSNVVAAQTDMITHAEQIQMGTTTEGVDLKQVTDGTEIDGDMEAQIDGTTPTEKNRL